MALRTVAIIAIEDCVFATLPRQQFSNLALKNSAVARKIFERLVRIIRGLDQRIFNLTVLNSTQRVAYELMKRAQPDQRNSSWHIIRPKPTQAEIAAWSGTALETVARVFGQMLQSHIIERQKGALRISDLGRLEELANEYQEFDRESTEAMCRGRPGLGEHRAPRSNVASVVT
ncbi:MAG: Crp/Fnr family transcriptional regulator [Alphaproteobacteria bacterium]|nr:Crp/Fnr family transcriptional regulator [Alphaproteobacteria bacterium]